MGWDGMEWDEMDEKLDGFHGGVLQMSYILQEKWYLVV